MGFSGWDAAAAVGAASGVPALGWQVWSWQRSGPRIEVKVANAWPVDGPTQQMGDHHFQVTAVNVGRARTEVSSWGIRLPDGSDLVSFAQLPGSEPPGPVEPQGQRRFLVRAADAISSIERRGFRARECRAWVRLTTGREIMGPPLPWKDDDAAATR